MLVDKAKQFCQLP